MNKTNAKSGVVIARLLCTEGFTCRTANMVRRWWRRRLTTDRQNIRYGRARKALSEMLKRTSMSEGDKLILGKFIQMHSGVMFSAGLRVGLQTSIKLGEDAS